MYNHMYNHEQTTLKLHDSLYSYSVVIIFLCLLMICPSKLINHALYDSAVVELSLGGIHVDGGMMSWSMANAIDVMCSPGTIARLKVLGCFRNLALFLSELFFSYSSMISCI